MLSEGSLYVDTAAHLIKKKNSVISLTHKAPAIYEWSMQTMQISWRKPNFPPQSHITPHSPFCQCMSSFYQCLQPRNIPFLFHLGHFPPPRFPLFHHHPIASSCSEPVTVHCNRQLCFSPLLWPWQRGPVPSRRLRYRLPHEADTLG